jgi:hypothetical protein
MCLEGVDEASEGLIDAPLRCNVGDDLDLVAITLDSINEAVATASAIGVAETTQQGRRSIALGAGRRRADERGDSLCHELAIAGDHRDRVGVAFRRGAVKVHHWDARCIGYPDGGNHGFRIGMDDDDPIDAALNHGLDLRVLERIIHA